MRVNAWPHQCIHGNMLATYLGDKISDQVGRGHHLQFLTGRQRNRS